MALHECCSSEQKVEAFTIGTTFKTAYLLLSGFGVFVERDKNIKRQSSVKKRANSLED